MPSVENFYWILYQNLLKPTGLDCWYYYPWGTKQNLSRAGEFQSFYRKQHGNHVLFHFDQEPLWQDDLGCLYDQELGAWNVKMIRILANSEHSDHKRSLLKKRQMLDWYFFYHGFAALDWYRDTKYIEQETAIRHAFLSFNHIVSSRRCYRLDLISRLLTNGVIDQGKISLHTSREHVESEINDAHTCLSDSARQRIEQNLLNRHDLPWKLDEVAIDGNLSARFGHKEYALMQSCLLHVVNETVFYEPKLHLTEKIFKPIVTKRPFVLVGAPGNLSYLKGYGFRTFGEWIDESYDNIKDPDQRLHAITVEITKLSQLSLNQLHAMHRDMQEVLDFNKRHLFGTFREIIVDELINNFETCVRIWNNGRVDGKQIPVHPDLQSVRTLLLQ